MQNHPSIPSASSSHPGQPAQFQGSYPPIGNVPAPNASATISLVMGIISSFYALFVLIELSTASRTSDPIMPIALFIGGSLFALPSIAFGKAGLGTSIKGGELRSAFGVIFGYFFFISFLAGLLMHLLKAQ